MIRTLFMSEAAWRTIPIVTSVVCFIGLRAAVQLVGIARRNAVAQLAPKHRGVANLLHYQARGWSFVMLLLVLAGVLQTIGTWGRPPPPTSGSFLALWILHYVVGVTATILSAMTVHALRVRLKL